MPVDRRALPYAQASHHATVATQSGPGSTASSTQYFLTSSQHGAAMNGANRQIASSAELHELQHVYASPWQVLPARQTAQ